MILTLANARNGLPLVNKPDGISMFLSTHAHRPPYFRGDAMPYHAVVHLLNGGTVKIVDASTHKGLPDALVTGVGTWALVFGRAIGMFSEVPWATPAMRKACWSEVHRPTVQAIRRLVTVYGKPERPLSISAWTCRTRIFNGRILDDGLSGASPGIICVGQRATWDDKPEVIRQLMEAASV